MRIASGLVAALLLGAAISASAQDDDSGYRFQPDAELRLSDYVALRGSLAFANTTAAKTPKATPITLRASYNTGRPGSIYLGARLPSGLRIEVEAL